MASTQEHDGGAAPAVEEMSYTDASDELDAIVRFFEDRDVDVDQLVGRLVRATAIIEELDKRLRRTRVQVEQLVPKLTKVLSATGQLDDDLADELTDEAGDELGEAGDELGEAGDELDDTQEATAPSARARRAGADTAALF